MLTLQYIISDLARNGVPAFHFEDDGFIKLRVRDKTYAFHPYDLKLLDLLERPMQNRAYEPDFPVMQVSNLAATHINIPAVSDQGFCLFKAQHKVATELCKKYWALHFQYVEVYNTLTQYLWDELQKDFGQDIMETVTKTVYNVPLIYINEELKKIPRIRLV